MRTFVMALAAPLLFAPAAVSAQTIRYEGSLGVSSGTYIFTERTTTWSLLSGLAFETGRLAVRVGLPVYVQDTRLVSGTATGLLPSGGPAAGAVADSVRARVGRGGSPGGGGGPSPAIIADPVETPETVLTGYEAHVGDPTFGVGYTIQAGTNVLVTLSGDAKAPVTDTASYGTGAWDFGAGASVSVLSESGVFVSGSGAFWSLGDLPDLELEDLWLGSLSIGVLRPGGWSLTGFLAASSSVIAEFAPPVTVGFGVSRLVDRRSVGMTLGVGLTETAADLSVGLSWGLAGGGTS